MFLERKLKDQDVWINIDSDDVKQTAQIYQDYEIDKETIEYALDKNERAHMDYNRENGTVVFIYNVLDLATDKEHYEAYTERHEPVSVYKFLFASLELISNSYYPVVERMDKRKDEINALLRQTTTKKQLFALSDLETSMVYLVAAAKQNRMLLEHIKSHGIYRRFDDLETEQFEDAMIEARQLVSMTDLIAQVLSQLSGSYNNILNNNLNDNLTVLTIISVLLAVLAVITGFFGMNVPLPLSNDKNAWIYIVVISLVIWGLLTKLLKWLANKK